MYQDALKKLDSTVDGLGLGIDPGIKHAVAAFNARGFITTGSCEGHLDRGFPYPWIDFGESHIQPDLEKPPKFLVKFVADFYAFSAKNKLGTWTGLVADIDNDNKRYTVIADSDGLKRLYCQANDDKSIAGTAQKNLKSAQQMADHLAAFYKQHSAPYAQMLSIQFQADYGFRMQPNCADLIATMSPSEQKQTRIDCLNHLNHFADFVINS